MDVLAQILAGEFRDPDDGRRLFAPIRTVVIEDDLAGREAELVAALKLGDRIAVVSDPTTHGVLGARTVAALRAIATVQSVVLPERPNADLATIERLRAATAAARALVAVGSGTINDLCKYASALDRKPYAVFATAPSMNGYTSVNAAITVQGHKKSLLAHAAAGVFFDLRVLAAAPARLIRAGLGDSLCRSTAQADWLLAHALFDRPYWQVPFALLGAEEGPLLAAAAGLATGDLGAIRRLVRTLVLSGFGMSLWGGSDPASQGEHLISHYADMMGDPRWPAAFHGEQIGVTTLTMARLQEHMLWRPAPHVQPSPLDEAALINRFGAELGSSCWHEFKSKRLDRAGTEAVNRRLTERWDAIRARIHAIRRPMAELEAALRQVGAPTTFRELGWTKSFYRDAVRHAREIRNRYTFLDLAADSGLLDRPGAFI